MSVDQVHDAFIHKIQTSTILYLLHSRILCMILVAGGQRAPTSQVYTKVYLVLNAKAVLISKFFSCNCKRRF